MALAGKQGYPASSGDIVTSQTLVSLDTTDTTLTTIHTVSPVVNSAVLIKVFFVARETGVNQTTGFLGEKQWHITRGTGAPVLLSGAGGDGFQNENFPGPTTFIATVSGNDILIRVTGRPATNINWQASFLIIENLNNG